MIQQRFVIYPIGSEYHESHLELLGRIRRIKRNGESSAPYDRSKAQLTVAYREVNRRMVKHRHIERSHKR